MVLLHRLRRREAILSIRHLYLYLMACAIAIGYKWYI